MSTVLVTGAGGVVGRALVEHLRASGDDVHYVSSRAQCDLESGEAALSYFRSVGPEKVYHLAGAVFGVGGNLAFPGDAFRRNTLMNVNVVEAARAVGAAKIVAMGTAAIYADKIAQPMSEDDALTGEPHGSEFAYAHAKRGLLVMLESYKQQFGLDYVYAISTNLYGPHDRFNPQYGHVIPSLICKFEAAMRGGGIVEIWGDGSPTRDFLYASDAARGLKILMDAGVGRYNLASGVSCSIKHLVESLSALYPDVAYTWDVSKPLGQLQRSYDVSRLEGLGFACDHSLEMGLRETVDWVQRNAGALRS